MKKLLIVKSERFDLYSIRPQLDEVVSLFDRYLDEYPVKTARSKHAVMGPVAKIIDRAKTGNWDAQSLTGYALRVHEMNPKSRGYLSAEARESLERGTRLLLELCSKVPLTVMPKVMERIDYSIYYTRRAKSIKWLEAIRQKFIGFVKEKYNSSLEDLMQSWGKEVKEFDEIRYPSHKNKEYQKGGNYKADIDEFWVKQKEAGVEESMDEEEE